MKPKTQIQRQADELSKTLRPLPRYIIDKFCQHTEQNNRKRYYAVLEQKQEFTVLRYFSFIKHKKIDNVCEEFMQVWISKHGNAVRAKQRFSMGHYFDTFIKDSPLEIRTNKKNYGYNRLTDISFTKLFIRSRKAQLTICNYKENQFYMIGRNYVWLTDDMNVDKFPFLETIIKQKPRIAELILLNRLQNEQEVVKLAWKHGYLTEDLDYNLWRDTISMARQLHYDMHNPLYVCPRNLETAHNLYARRLNRQTLLEQRRMKAMRAISDKQAKERFEKFIKKFLDFFVSDGKVTIQPLKSVDEFKKEGELMHHCVFANGYYKKPDCLILSAQVDGAHTETIEIDLRNFSIVQSRGVCNQPSAYHTEIINLMRENMSKIKTLTYTKKRKEVA